MQCTIISNYIQPFSYLKYLYMKLWKYLSTPISSPLIVPLLPLLCLPCGASLVLWFIIAPCFITFAHICWPHLCFRSSILSLPSCTPSLISSFSSSQCPRFPSSLLCLLNCPVHRRRRRRQPPAPCVFLSSFSPNFCLLLLLSNCSPPLLHRLSRF